MLCGNQKQSARLGTLELWWAVLQDPPYSIHCKYKGPSSVALPSTLCLRYVVYVPPHLLFVYHGILVPLLLLKCL